MKRSGSLARRSVLRRGGPLRQRSVQREAFYRTVRRPMVAEWLAGYPRCERCGTERATEAHELLSRARGGALDDRGNVALLCRTCHRWVTEHPRLATDEGWLRHSWERP